MDKSGGERYVTDNETLNGYMTGYSTLNEEERDLVRQHTVGDEVQLRATALRAVGQHP